MHLDPSPYCLVLMCRNILHGCCNEAVEARVRVTPQGGCSNDFVPFRTISLLHSFITVVGQTGMCGLENARKGKQEQQRLEEGREGETYGTYSTLHEMCDGCLSCHWRVAHASRFCSGQEHCSPNMA